MVRLLTTLLLLGLAACSSSGPDAGGTPTPTTSKTLTSTIGESPTATPKPKPVQTLKPGVAKVYKFSQGQATLRVSGELPFKGDHLFDRGFSAPAEGDEKDGTYGWLTSAGDRLVLNVPSIGAWTVSGVIDGSSISFEECSFKIERNDATGLAGTFSCGRVTRAGTVAPAGTAAATFGLEP